MFALLRVSMLIACFLLSGGLASAFQESEQREPVGGLPLAMPQTSDMHLIDNREMDFVNLFDGTSLFGWSQKNGTAKFKVVDGTICGTTEPGSPNSFLCTDDSYSDFELRFEVKVDDGLNSGVQIRSISDPAIKNGRVHGPQVEIEAGPGEAGFIYSEGTGRNWISKNPQPHGVFKNGRWNYYRVVAEGNRIQTWINGEAIEDIDTADIESQSGFLGLQVHSIGKDEGPFKVQWRNIRIKELNGSETRHAFAAKGTPKIDGKVDDVWNTAPRIVTARQVDDLNKLGAGEQVARADVRCLWDDEYLYCLAVVKDSNLQAGGDQDWQHDSVEWFVDAGLDRQTTYDDNDAQYRTNCDGDISMGENANEDNYESKVTKTDGGYIVEAKIKMSPKMSPKAGGQIGFDVQVNNDTGDGTRSSAAKWNDPTNDSYQDPTGFGVLEFKAPEKQSK